MEASSFRPLSAEEKRVLARLSSPAAGRANALLATACVFMLVFGGGTALVRVFFGPPQGARLGWVAGFAGVVALWTLVAVLRGPARVLGAERERLAQDLAGGRAACTTYEVHDALRVEEAEDEGSSYYLRLADGRVLFLSGQYLYECEELGAFPCSRFTLVRAPASGLFLDMTELGAPLVPSGTLPSFTSADHHAERVPRDGDVLDVEFESLRPKRAG